MAALEDRIEADLRLGASAGMPLDPEEMAHSLCAAAWLSIQVDDPQHAMARVRRMNELLAPVQRSGLHQTETMVLEARVLLELGRADESEALFRQALRTAGEVFGIPADRVRAESGLASGDPAIHAAVIEVVRAQLGADRFDELHAGGHATPIPAMAGAVLDG